MEENNNQFKITCQCFNYFLTCKFINGELLYITFLHTGLYTLGLYSEELDTENFYLQWPSRTKMQRIYQRFLKYGNGDNKFMVSIFSIQQL